MRLVLVLQYLAKIRKVNVGALTRMTSWVEKEWKVYKWVMSGFLDTPTSVAISLEMK
jgi:hypothetical protein